jgi:hypothetical protein
MADNRSRGQRTSNGAGLGYERFISADDTKSHAEKEVQARCADGNH